MGEVSKTARASMVQDHVAKKDHYDTNEKKIAELRRQRDPGFPLAVNRYDFIDALLQEFDKAQAQLAAFNISSGAANETIATLEKTLADKQVILDSFVSGAAADDVKLRAARKLTDAVQALYYAAVWHADRPVDETTLWTAVRDAAGFDPGKAPVEIPAPVVESRQEHDVIMREITG